MKEPTNAIHHVQGHKAEAIASLLPLVTLHIFGIERANYILESISVRICPSIRLLEI